MKTVAQVIAEIDRMDGPAWIRRVTYLHPNHVLELGTGQGSTGSIIMKALPQQSTFTTINYDWPENQEFGQMLGLWRGNPRLREIRADTTLPATLDLVPDGVDLLYIDTHHFAWQAALELELWQRKLVDGAIVIVDDLDQNDMEAFWATVLYDKERVGMQGLFRYDAARPYVNWFPRGVKPSEGWRNG
jgi:predicted O-methyltransferase YrrM